MILILLITQGHHDMDPLLYVYNRKHSYLLFGFWFPSPSGCHLPPPVAVMVSAPNGLSTFLLCFAASSMLGKQVTCLLAVCV